MYFLDKNSLHITANLLEKSKTFSFVLSFAGETLNEIADWYPKPITTPMIFNYLAQEHQFKIMEEIIAYIKNPTLKNDDLKAKIGLIDFCACADWLSHRVCFMVYVGTDDWLLLHDNHRETRHKRIAHSDYNIKDYLEYLLTLEGGNKRYITPYEFKEFLQDSKTHQNSEESLYNKPYSIDSLFFVLFQHGKEYGYSYDDIITKVLVRKKRNGLHPGVANEFLKYHDFLIHNCAGKDSILTQDNIFLNFFNRINIQDNQLDDPELRK